METMKEKLAGEIARVLKISVIAKDLSTPPKVEMGDFSWSCFVLAKERKQAVNEVAQELAQTLNKTSGQSWQRVEAIGPYVNFYLDLGKWNHLVLTGDLNFPKTGKKLMIEFSQPNTHKEFHVGHLRTAFLGASLVNIFRTLGNEVVAANYIGDAGVHVAKCLWYVDKFNPELIHEENESEAKFYGRMYSSAVKMIDEQPELMAEVSAVQKKIESHDDHFYPLWQSSKAKSFDAFLNIYKRLDIKFDEWFWESEEEVAGRECLRDIMAKKSVSQIKESEGAIIADLREFGLEVLVLIKSDGNVLYGTKDLPLGKKKFDQFGVDKSIYVIDNRQSLYVKQIFKLLDLLGYENKEKVHVSYDFVTLPDGAMASRKGNVVALEDFLDAVKSKVLEETVKRHSDWPEEKCSAISEKIALAAVKFFMLKYENNSVIVFDMVKATAIDGASGPYLMYCLARMNSLERKARWWTRWLPKDYLLLSSVEERELIKHISQFEEAIKTSALKYQPSILCTFLLDLAQRFNGFYHAQPILKSASKLQASRLALVKKVKTVMLQGLALLNIEGLDEM
jgi:arginyl-tRNA synthetase